MMNASGIWIGFMAVIVVGMCASCQSAAAPKAGESWQQAEAFPIMTWEPGPTTEPLFSDAHSGVGSLKDCGFNVAGFPRPQHLKECEKLGLNVILGNGKHPVDWTKLSDEEIDANVKAMVDEGKNSPAVMGYFIVDEPGIQKFSYLAKAVAAVKKYAPGKLAYINLYPDYATLGNPSMSQLGTESYDEYLEKYIEIVKPQFLSYDNYRVEFSMDLKDPKLAASYYRNLLAVRKAALKHNLPFWNIVCCNQIRPHTTPPSPANFLHQAYTTLAAGGKGLTWFKYYARKYGYPPISEDGKRTVTWSYLKFVNEQVAVVGPAMSKLTSTGVYFTKPAPVEGLATLPGELLQDVTCATPLMIGEFKDDGGARYAMVVNLGLHESAKFSIKQRSGSGATEHLSPADGSWSAIPADNSLWLTAGQGVLLRFR